MVLSKTIQSSTSQWPNEDDLVPIVFVSKLIGTANRLGYPAESFLKEMDLTQEYIDNKRNYIPYRTQFEIINRVVAEVTQPGFGLMVGRAISMLDWGVVGYAFISSANMREARDTFSAYQRLNGPLVNVYCCEERDECIFLAIEAFPLGTIYQFALEDWLAENRMTFERFKIKDIRFSEVRLSIPEPAHLQMYQELYDCPIRFNQPTNEIRFPRSFLEAPLDGADEVVAELCIRKCAEVMKHLSEEDPIVDAVRRVLLSKPGGAPTLEVVAASLHISPRSLRRRLHEASTSYRKVLSDTRLGLAAEYLRNTNLAPKEIAYSSGYSGVSGFYRAFSAKFGTTPIKYREGS